MTKTRFESTEILTIEIDAAWPCPPADDDDALAFTN